ncbi:cytochrome P450 [Tanacetum coccineum]
MLRDDNQFLIQSLWGSKPYGFSVKKVEGKSGGILAIWEAFVFNPIYTTSGDGFLAILGNWRGVDVPCLKVVVYAPQDRCKKKKLWLEISNYKISHDTLSVVLGDFNEVRNANELMGSQFCQASASSFNAFINSTSLVDKPMGGKRFTRMNNLGSKLSKNNRIFVSEHYINRWPNAHTLALTREFSDHCSLLLLNSTTDFGPTPFKFFNSWLLHKTAIKTWRKKVSGVESATAETLRNTLNHINSKVEQNTLSQSNIDVRTKTFKLLTTLENNKINDLRQKAKIRWALKGYASILINRSPTKDFKLERGLKQVGVDKVPISHLHFADNALIIGEWSIHNVRNLSRILAYFHLASGLKVNFNKSKLFGLCVPFNEVCSVASLIGCQPSQLPCIYLSLPIGANMSRCVIWKPLVDRFHKRLSKWKSKILSIGGRLTLIKTILGSFRVYFFSSYKDPKSVISELESLRRSFFWGGSKEDIKIAWEKVISPRDQRGLSIGSLRVSNLAMLAKWWWRFLNEKESLWCKVIRSLHGLDGGLIDNSTSSLISGCWFNIVKLKDDLCDIGINLTSLFKKKVENGLST